MSSEMTQTPRRILIADDSMLTRRVVRKQLAMALPEADVLDAGDGAEALCFYEDSRTKGVPFDLILLDYMMPEKTGLEVLEHIRRTDTEVPVFILSANIQEATRKRAFELGCTDFIKKTLNAGDLIEGLGLKVSV